MNTASILIKTNPEIKTKAEKTAKSFGFSLHTLLNDYLKHIVKTKTITFTPEELTPSPYLQKIIKKAEKNRAKDSPRFTNAKDAITYLHQQTQ